MLRFPNNRPIHVAVVVIGGALATVDGCNGNVRQMLARAEEEEKSIEQMRNILRQSEPIPGSRPPSPNINQPNKYKQEYLL